MKYVAQAFLTQYNEVEFNGSASIKYSITK